MWASSHLCSGSRERHRSLPLLLGQQDREKRGVRECPTGPLLKAQGRQAAGSQRPKGPCSQQHTAAQTAAAVLPGSRWAPSWCASCTGPSLPLAPRLQNHPHRSEDLYLAWLLVASSSPFLNSSSSPKAFHPRSTTPDIPEPRSGSSQGGRLRVLRTSVSSSLFSDSAASLGEGARGDGFSPPCGRQPRAAGLTGSACATPGLGSPLPGSLHAPRPGVRRWPCALSSPEATCCLLTHS